LYVNSDFTTSAIVPALEIALGLVLARSSMSKLRYRGAFQTSVGQFELVPSLLVGPFALFIALSEASLATVLILGAGGPLRLAATWLAAALFSLFILAVSSALAGGFGSGVDASANRPN
jgi:predicted permease